MDYKREMNDLRGTLSEAGYRYYVLDDPAMPDYEYDRLLRRLEEQPLHLTLVFLRGPGTAALADGDMNHMKNLPSLWWGQCIIVFLRLSTNYPGEK